MASYWRSYRGYLFVVFKHKGILFDPIIHYFITAIVISIYGALSVQSTGLHAIQLLLLQRGPLNFSIGYNLRDHLILHFHFAHAEIEIYSRHITLLKSAAKHSL